MAKRKLYEDRADERKAALEQPEGTSHHLQDKDQDPTHGVKKPGVPKKPAANRPLTENQIKRLEQDEPNPWPREKQNDR